MKRLHKAVISLGIVAVLLSGSSSAFARANSSKERAISGLIVSVDRNARTIIVRPHGSAATILVKVPAGRTVRTAHSGFAAASFEQLIPGMFIRDVNVQ